MPIYEYKCRACGTSFEAIRPMGDDGGGVECPVCGQHEADKQPSSFAAGSSRSASSGAGCGGRRFG